MSKSKLEHIKNHLASMAANDNRSKRQSIRVVIVQTLDKYKKKKDSEYNELIDEYNELLVKYKESIGKVNND